MRALSSSSYEDHDGVSAFMQAFMDVCVRVFACALHSSDTLLLVGQEKLREKVDSQSSLKMQMASLTDRLDEMEAANAALEREVCLCIRAVCVCV